MKPIIYAFIHKLKENLELFGLSVELYASQKFYTGIYHYSFSILCKKQLRLNAMLRVLNHEFVLQILKQIIGVVKPDKGTTLVIKKS